MNRISKIAVLCQYEFPVGMAPSTRIISYCKGLQTNGIQCEIYSFHWRADNEGKNLEGSIDGIRYKIGHLWHSSRSKLYKNTIDRLATYLNPVLDIMRSNKKGHIDYVFLSFDTHTHLFLYAPILRLCGLKLVFIGDEFPEAIRMMKDDISRTDRVLYRWISHLLDRRILMTETLKDFYNKIHTLPTHIMCSILDETRFTGLKTNKIVPEYLCYMGNLQLSKDNVENIIKAFALISKDYPELELRLYGNPTPSDKARVIRCIETFDMKSSIRYMGKADYCEVPQILHDAKILVTSQPDSVRAQGGFPTKMGEYMMSGRPMLVTDVGEITKFVTDGVTAFIVEPENPAKYADKLCTMLSNPQLCDDVARNAYEYAIANFTASHVTKALIDFLSE